MKNLPNLEGRLVKLGCFTPEHVRQYHSWLQDDYILKMTETDRGFTLKDVAGMCKEIKEADDMAHFLIFDKKTKKPVGDADLRDIKVGDAAECAVMIGEPDFRNKGYATEAMELLLRYGFETFNLNTVTAPILYFNKPSIALHEKLDFKKKGRKGKDIIYELKRN